MLMYMYENEYDHISILWLWQKKQPSHCYGCVLDVLCGFLFVLFLLAMCPAVIICLCFYALTTLIRNV